MIRNLFFVILTFFIGQICAADVGALNWDLRLQKQPLCQTAEVEHFWQSFHPGYKNRQRVSMGYINENNPGTAITCYWYQNNISGKAFLHAGELINSQFRETTVLGIGYRQQVLSYYGLSVSLAMEIAHLEYGVFRNSSVARAYIPLPSGDLAYDLAYIPREILPRELLWLRWAGKIGIRQYLLPKDHITLTSFIWQFDRPF